MLYRWHPFYGRKLKLVKTAKVAGIDDLYCETPSGIVLATANFSATCWRAIVRRQVGKSSSIPIGESSRRFGPFSGASQRPRQVLMEFRDGDSVARPSS